MENSRMEQYYEFGQFRLDKRERRLLFNGDPRFLQPKAFDLLVMLVANSNRLVSRNELMEKLWPRTTVEPANLTVNIYEIRKTLGDQGRHFIKTISKVGYLFAGEVRVLESAGSFEKPQGGIPDAVKTISPQFAAIYNEAVLAEQQNLLQICGLGYRKALEILMKDYAIKKDPLNERKIHDKTLNECILEYLENDTLKKFVIQASFLGNQQLHYMSHWDDQALRELKVITGLIVSRLIFELELKTRGIHSSPK